MRKKTTFLDPITGFCHKFVINFSIQLIFFCMKIFYRPTLKEVNLLEFNHLFQNQIKDKSAFIIEIGNLNNGVSRKSSKYSKIDNFVLNPQQLGFLLTSNNFLIRNIEKSLERLMPAGIIDYYIRSCTSWTFQSVAERKLPFLTLHDLRIVFFLLSGCCAACFVTFCVEILIFKVFKKKVNNNEQEQHLEKVQEEITKLVGFLIDNVDEKVENVEFHS